MQLDKFIVILVKFFLGYSLWTLKFPWISTLYLPIFYYHCKHNYHSIFMLKLIDFVTCLSRCSYSLYSVITPTQRLMTVLVY